MDERYRSQAEIPPGEIATVEFQAGERAEPPLDLIEIPLIDIHANDPLYCCAVDLFEAVATRYSEHGDTLRKAAIEGALEEFGRNAQLPNAFGAHVRFIVFQGNGEPRIRHGLILGVLARLLGAEQVAEVPNFHNPWRARSNAANHLQRTAAVRGAFANLSGLKFRFAVSCYFLAGLAIVLACSGCDAAAAMAASCKCRFPPTMLAIVWSSSPSASLVKSRHFRSSSKSA